MKKILLWVIAFFVTLLFAYYQRVTGPTYPMKFDKQINNVEVKGQLLRSGYSSEDAKVEISLSTPEATGILYYKRFKTTDKFTQVEMKREGNKLFAYLPKQPPAGKLEYYVELNIGGEKVTLPDEHVVIRFKGEIPLAVLILHVLFMFTAFFLSMRTGLEYFNKEPNVLPLLKWTLVFLIFGGFVLGPIVQYYAFGAFWTGFPFGHDLTDNKTAIAILGWLWAYYKIHKGANPKKWALIGSIILILVYLIPHSVLGSELKYQNADSVKTVSQKVIEK